MYLMKTHTPYMVMHNDLQNNNVGNRKANQGYMPGSIQLLFL